MREITIQELERDFVSILRSGVAGEEIINHASGHTNGET